MSGISGLVSNSLTGLQAAQEALQVTGNNIANVNTPGYSREQAIQSTQPPTLLGGLYLGNGTQVETVTRSYSSYLQSQVWSTTATASGANTLNNQLQPIVNLLAGTGSSLNTAINQFFASGVAQVAASPSDVPARQNFISQAQVLAQTMQSSAQQLQNAASGVNQQIGQSITAINSLTQQIAQLNIQINKLSGSGQAPNTLLDQQNQLVTELSAQVGINVLQQGNQVNVYTGNGQVLVAGNQSYALKAATNSYDPAQIEVAYVSNGAIISSGLQGGNLGGLLQFRSQVLQPAQNALGQIADGLAQAMNTQQAQGLNLNGTFGAAMFSTGNPQVLSNGNNTGSAQISASIVNTSGLTAADYLARFDGTNWTVTNLSSKQIVSSGSALPLSFDGVQLTQTSGTPKNGDSFLIEPTRYGALNFQSLLTTPSAIAASSPYISSAGSIQSGGALVNSNLGHLTLSAGGFSATGGSASVNLSNTLANPPAPLQLTLTSSGVSGDTVTFQVTSGSGATSGVVGSGSLTLGTSGTTIGINYPNTPPAGQWQVTLSGSTAASGDAFSLTPGGPGNGNNAQAMASLQTTKSLNRGTTSLEGAYGQLVSQVASQGSQAQSSLSAAAAVVQQASAAQQSVSGVNLDQEATNLIQYQQAYQAAAKAIQVGNSLFQSLIQAL